MTALASLPDAELVRLARRGRRDAFAVLYHRHVGRVYDVVRSGSADAAIARGTTVAVFSDLMRHLGDVDPTLVGVALEQRAARRVRGHAAGRVPGLTVGAVDAMWRELDRRWPSGEPPRKDVGTMVPVTAGALVAVMVLGTLASTSRRGGVPDPSRTFEAVAFQDAPVLPGLPRPRVTPAGSELPEPVPEPTATVALPEPEPTAEPTSDATDGPSEPPATETEEPDAAPEVTIRSPADGSTRMSDGEDEGGAYATVELDGVAVDDRDAADALTYSWTSSIDGVLGSSPSGTARLHVPDGQLTATHRITFSATDTAGNTATTSVNVVVTRV